MSILDDDGYPSADFIAVEEADSNGHAQALWVGVRPVFHGSEQSAEPMVQICYQEKYEASHLTGPVWLTPQTWEELNKAVKWRIKYQRKARRVGRWNALSDFLRKRQKKWLSPHGSPVESLS